MIKAIITGIFKLITSLINIILLPINALINTFIPDLNNVFGIITNFFNYAFNLAGYILDMLCIPPIVANLFVAYITFKLTAPYAINAIKLALKWYNTLKL